MTKARDLANASTALSAVSATELAFVDGVTSAIQTQMDAKAPSSTAATLSGTQTLTNKTIDTASNTITGAVTLTGTQTLTNKTLTSPVIASVINNTLTSTTGDIIYASAANTPARLGIGSTANVLTVSGGVPVWSAPAGGGGKVLQVVTAAYGTSKTNATSTLANTDLTATITPATTGSRILVMVTHGDIQRYGSNTQSALVMKLLRGASVIYSPGNSEQYTGAAESRIFSMSFQYVDSPNTVSATTYKTQFANYANDAGVVVNFNSVAGTSQIILMEIGA